jgi:hypothetical protein
LYCTLLFCFVVFFSSVIYKINDWNQNSLEKDIINYVNDLQLKLWNKEIIEYNVNSLLNHNINLKVNKNMRVMSKMIDWLDNYLIAFVCNLILFLVFIKSLEIKIYTILSLLVYNAVMFIFINPKPTDKYKWQNVFYYNNFNKVPKINKTKTQWFSISIENFVSQFYLLGFYICILNQGSFDLLEFINFFIFAQFLNKKETYLIVSRYKLIMKNYKEYYDISQKINIDFSSFHLGINEIFGVGQNRLISKCILNSPNASMNISLNEIFFISNNKRFNGSIKEYFNIHFPFISLEEIIENIDDMNILQEYFNHDITQIHLENQSISNETKFLLDICKSFLFKGSIIIIDNPIYLKDEWVTKWKERYKYIIILNRNKTPILQESKKIII